MLKVLSEGLCQLLVLIYPMSQFVALDTTPGHALRVEADAALPLPVDTDGATSALDLDTHVLKTLL